MSFRHRIIAPMLSLLLAALAPACVAAPESADDVQEEAVESAASALQQKSAALAQAMNAVIQQDPAARQKFAQAALVGLPVAPIVSVLGNRYQVLIPVRSVLQDPAVKSAILAASGPVLTADDVATLGIDAHILASLKQERLKLIVQQYEYAGYTPAYGAELVDAMAFTYDEMMQMAACDLFVADDIALAAAMATAFLGGATLGWAICTWHWDHSDDDGDGVLNKDDKHPYDKNKEFRYPPWLETGSLWTPFASDAQQAIDVTGALFSRLIPPGANAIDPAFADSRIQSAPGMMVTFPGGVQARLAFLP